MTAQALASPNRIYQIKVALVGISPLIWRRLLVPDATSIAELHYILQIVMGWEDYHLHRFQIYDLAEVLPEFRNRSSERMSGSLWPLELSRDFRRAVLGSKFRRESWSWARARQ